MAKQLLEPHLWDLETVFKCVYNVPVYQRPYSWDKEQVKVLLSDIFSSYESEHNYNEYYTGNIIIYDKDSKINGYITTYDIIDGQQRITTFSLILLAIYSMATTNGANLNDQTILKLKESLWKSVHRENQKELRAVTINSIERDCYNSIYDKCFDDPNNIFNYINNYECKQAFDQRILSNFSEIYEYLNIKFNNKSVNDILDFADYILSYIKFITIEANCKQKDVFCMFESINSKGKKLEIIDLIKNYIFSKIDENSYREYSIKWGKLINKTQDKLYDYLYTYIRAYISYYRQNINIDNFKSISKDLINVYNVSSEQEALKKLIDELIEKVHFYNMLDNTEDAYNLIKSSKFRFFFNIFVKVGYQHPKPLFFRTLIEYNEEKIDKSEVEDIIIETVSFMIKFLTISDRDSKDAINVFKEIMTEIIIINKISKKPIINKLESQLILKGITINSLKKTLNNLDCYSSKKEISIPLIALYESTEKVEEQSNIKYKTSYNQAYELVKDFSRLYSLDHLLVRTPKKDDPNFKYYKNEIDNTLVLKENNDFPIELAQTGMDYDIFEKSVLNKIGNLRIYYSDKNSSRQNDGISLPENKNFYNYSNIKKRGNDIANIIFDVCLPRYKIDAKNMEDIGKTSKNNNLLNINDFFELGILNKGDRVYLTTKPYDSEAVLIDSKYVMYNNEKMTINEWGRKVNGWKSIRVYEYMSKLGEKETLQDKRERYQKEHQIEEDKIT